MKTNTIKSWFTLILFFSIALTTAYANLPDVSGGAAQSDSTHTKKHSPMKMDEKMKMDEGMKMDSNMKMDKEMKMEKSSSKEEIKPVLYKGVIDLKTIMPLDIQTILDSAKKTGRVITVHEAVRTCGMGAEISALVSEHAMEYMKAPILRVTGFDTPFPYTLEHVYLPDAARVVMAIEKVMGY